MESLNKILTTRTFKRESKRINIQWEKASEFGEYIGLPTTYVLKLFRVFGEEKVLGLRSDLRDIECDRSKFAGLVYWKLKQAVIQ